LSDIAVKNTHIKLYINYRSPPLYILGYLMHTIIPRAQETDAK